MVKVNESHQLAGEEQGSSVAGQQHHGMTGKILKVTGTKENEQINPHNIASPSLQQRKQAKVLRMYQKDERNEQFKLSYFLAYFSPQLGNIVIFKI